MFAEITANGMLRYFLFLIEAVILRELLAGFPTGRDRPALNLACAFGAALFKDLLNVKSFLLGSRDFSSHSVLVLGHHIVN